MLVGLIAASGPVALVSVAFIASIVGRVGRPAFGAALPNLVGDEELEWANASSVRSSAERSTSLLAAQWCSRSMPLESWPGEEVSRGRLPATRRSRP
jgi:hypothetical protein